MSGVVEPLPPPATPASGRTSGRGATLGWGVLATVVALALAARAGAPPEGALLGAGEGLPARVWALAYAGGAFWDDGLTTTRALFPTGVRVWPPLEGVLLGPIVAALGATAAWNLLAALRILAAGMGGALLLRRLGLHPSWGLLVAVPVAAGTAPELAWMPLGLALLLGGAPPAPLSDRPAPEPLPSANVATATATALATGAAAGLAWATHAGAALGGWIAVALLAPHRLRTPAAAVAAVVTALAWVGEAWVLRDPLDTVAAEALWTLTPRPDRVAGDLPGLLGLGPRPWGSPLLFLTLLPVLSRARAGTVADADATLGRRAAALAALGALVALGPVLIVHATPVVFNGRTIPLPFLAASWLPPAAAAADLVPFALLAWLGAAVAGGAGLGPRRAPLWALALLLLAPAPSWTVPPSIPVAEGPVLDYPLPRGGWPLHAAARDNVSTSAGLGRAAPDGLLDVIGREGWSLVELRAWATTQGFRTLRADPEALGGQGAEVAFLLGEVVPVAREWPDVHLLADGLSTHDTILALPTDPTIPPPDDWGWRDPDLVKFLDDTLFPRARFLVRLYTSADGVAWTRADAPFAHSFTSLGLTVVGDDEALILSGTPGLDGWLAREFPQMHPASVTAFTTADLETWGVRRWWLDRRVSAVDPQVDADADGIRLTAWMRTGAIGSDPISLAGDHPVFEARLGSDGRFHTETPYTAHPWLADPMRVGGRLYATSLAPGTAPRVVVLGGADWREVATLPAVSVPFVTGDDANWSMLVHSPEGQRFGIARMTSADGVTWSAPTQLYLPGAPACESPVSARFRGRYVVVCSERIGGSQEL